MSGNEQQHMNVIRHHTPRLQLISLAIEMPKSIGDDLSVLPQNPASVAAVEERIQQFAEGAVDCDSSCCGRGRGSQVRALVLQACDDMRRQRVVESERHEVRSIVGLPMRQATAVANAQTSNSEELFSRHDTRRKARVGGGWAEYTSAAGRRRCDRRDAGATAIIPALL